MWHREAWVQVGKPMINTGNKAGYWVVTWADGFDPSLDDLLPHVPEAVVGRRVLIASFDSGQFEPTQEELDNGWSAQLAIFNLFDSHDNAADFFYADRLPGEPAAGVEDLHIHPLEPRAFRFTVSKTF